MTESTAGSARQPNPLLFVSARLGALEDFLGALRADAVHGAAVLGTFEADEQAKSFEAAREALRAGMTGTGTRHFYLLLAGDVAARMTRANLDELRAVARASWKLRVMGIARDQADLDALRRLGVAWIIDAARLADDAFQVWMAAHADFNARKAEIDAAPKEASQVVVINRDADRGLLRDGGVIAVHATKGGVGKSSIAASLAWGLAQSGRRTILVDLNPDSGGAHLFFRKWLLKRYATWADFFAVKGLGALAPHVRFDAGRIAPVPFERVLDAVETIVDDGEVHLSLMAGIYSQSDYQAPTAGQKTAPRMLLENTRWVAPFLSLLRTPGEGWDYVVLDMGINRYTAMGQQGLPGSDVMVIVVDARAEDTVEFEVLQMRELFENIAAGREPMIKARRVVVANMLTATGTKFAPRLDAIRRAFEAVKVTAEDGRSVYAFDPQDVVGVDEDGTTMRYAKHLGVPPIAVDAKELAESPARRDLMAVVNTVKHVYDEDGRARNERPKRGFRLFGR